MYITYTFVSLSIHSQHLFLINMYLEHEKKFQIDL